MANVTDLSALEARIEELEQQLAERDHARVEAEANLERFRENEFDGFNGRNWDIFTRLHAEAVHVVMPDGTVVDGVKPHLKDMVEMTAYIPDARIDHHSVKLADGDWTAVIGTLMGTFSEPMPLPDGTSVPPTGGTLNLQVGTFSRWEDGQIAEELLFWDSGLFMRQLGLGA